MVEMLENVICRLSGMFCEQVTWLDQLMAEDATKGEGSSLGVLTQVPWICDREGS